MIPSVAILSHAAKVRERVTIRAAAIYIAIFYIHVYRDNYAIHRDILYISQYFRYAIYFWVISRYKCAWDIRRKTEIYEKSFSRCN